MFLGRKFSRPKWASTKPEQPSEIEADSIGDLRTSDNTLSFWCCGEGNEDEVNEVALALSTANRDRIERIDIVWIEVEELEAAGITLLETEGLTAAAHLKDTHRDAVDLRFGHLGAVASRVLGAIEADRWKRIPKGEVRKLIARAVEAGQLAEADLSDGMRNQLKS